MGFRVWLEREEEWQVEMIMPETDYSPFSGSPGCQQVLRDLEAIVRHGVKEIGEEVGASEGMGIEMSDRIAKVARYDIYSQDQSR